MIDHLSVPVKDFKQSRDFYDKTLAVLGFERVLNFEDETQQWAGYGTNDMPSFEICFKKNIGNEDIGKMVGLHVGFLAPTIEAVHQWYAKCLELGGADNGAPGPRPEYHPGYYGAFIVDPNGWRIEACYQNYQGKS
jgi:catechol 2,3-dioxygenase-like lactoylglutathione lyase family enzyme